MRAILFVVLLMASSATHAQDPSFPPIVEGTVYGRSCGFAGTDPPERSRLETLIHFQNRPGVLAMLNDSSLVVQAYGAEGVIRLQQQGLAFDQITTDRIAQLLKSTVPIRTCSGCIFGTMPLGFALQASIDPTRTR